MAGTSYQDIDTRLQQIERKVAFIMQSFSLTGVVDGETVPKARTLLEIYLAAQAAGIEV